MDSYKVEPRTRLRELMGCSKDGLNIPHMQRPYSWKSDVVREYTEFVFAELDSSPTSEMYGSDIIIWYNDCIDAKNVIDGQQRLITLTIIIGTIAIMFKDGDDAIGALANKVLLMRDGMTRIKTPLKNDQAALDDIANGRIPTAPGPILQATRACMSSLQDRYNRICDDDERADQRAFQDINNILTRVLFEVKTVFDIAMAIKIFDTINSKGVRLTRFQGLATRCFSFIGDETSDAKNMKLRQRLEVLDADVVKGIKPGFKNCTASRILASCCQMKGGNVPRGIDEFKCLTSFFSLHDKKKYDVLIDMVKSAGDICKAMVRLSNTANGRVVFKFLTIETVHWLIVPFIYKYGDGDWLDVFVEIIAAHCIRTGNCQRKLNGSMVQTNEIEDLYAEYAEPMFQASVTQPHKQSYIDGVRDALTNYHTHFAAVAEVVVDRIANAIVSPQEANIILWFLKSDVRTAEIEHKNSVLKSMSSLGKKAKNPDFIGTFTIMSSVDKPKNKRQKCDVREDPLEIMELSIEYAVELEAKTSRVLNLVQA